jgi:meso-butanediol dehydrogenase/(S,S)-butanediol dehydrogenase/diacetyl reductase
MKKLHGKVALITGGGTGIGEACAHHFTALGARVAVMGRRRELITRVAQAIDGIALVGDASKAAEMQDAVTQVKQRCGGIDILVACAGGHGLGTALQTDDAQWQHALDANLNTAFVAARATLPCLIERKGAAVMVASIASLAAGPEVCGYTTTKHALIGLTRSLARDYGALGVRVNAVCPGWVRTPMADEEMQPLMRQHGISLNAAYELVTRDVPLRRAATALEIAEVCAFLASAEASIITGATIVADGGSTIVDVPTLAFTHS